ncbi:hypothetical protein R85157_001079 [Carnimonas sp. R-85157]
MKPLRCCSVRYFRRSLGDRTVASRAPLQVFLCNGPTGAHSLFVTTFMSRP